MQVRADTASSTTIAPFYHEPVMKAEALDLLAVSHGVYVDATLGGGGHSAGILERLQEGLLIGIDRDHDALNFAGQRLAAYPNVRLVQGNFSELDRLIAGIPDAQGGVAGILFDLGLSYYQAVTPSRGFSYQSTGPLDMRFDQSSSDRTALDLIQRSSEQELARIIRDLGEERFYRRISRRVAALRGRLSSTADLANAIRSSVPARFQAKSVMRVFQSLRLAVNGELEAIEHGLRAAIGLLKEGGRIVVIAYHSLEDRIVKHVFREFKENRRLAVLTKKPLRPGVEEVARNPSARSARLRGAASIVRSEALQLIQEAIP